MAAKPANSKGSRLPSIFKASSSKSDGKRSNSESWKQKVSTLFSRIRQFSQKIQLAEFSSSPFSGLTPNSGTNESPASKTGIFFPKHDDLSFYDATEMSPVMKQLPKDPHELSPKIGWLSSKYNEILSSPEITDDVFSPVMKKLPFEADELPSKFTMFFQKHDQFCAPEVTDDELSPVMKELPYGAVEWHQNITMPFGVDERSPDFEKLPLAKGEEFCMTLNTDQLCYEKKRKVLPEVFIFPPYLSEASFDVEQHRGTSKPGESKPERELGAIEQQQRQRVTGTSDEPCINKYAQLISCRGIKLTKAAYELDEEQCRLLYEDIFKPLDFVSILLERSKTAPQGNKGLQFSVSTELSL